MRGLRKYLTPFAPDQSGAESVLYELGGIVVILDAGGCAGNICGFDEPRWSSRRSAVFSAGLRDMDAVMGRDYLLVQKICDTALKIDARFVAIIGTPVPAVIGTDLKAVERMLEKRIDIPVITTATDGMHLYDRGVQMAYRALFDELSGRGRLVQSSGKTTSQAEKKRGTDSYAESGHEKKTGSGRAGVFGVTPLDLPFPACADLIRNDLISEGYDDAVLYGSGAALEDYERAGENAVNIAASADGIDAVRHLEKKFGTPYQVRFPGAGHFLKEEDFAGHERKGAGRVLIVQNQVLGNSLREEIRRKDPGSEVVVADWFGMDPGILQPPDVHLKEEDDFTDLVNTFRPEVIIGDKVMQRMVPESGARWIHLPQFSVSGKREAGS